jgi:hypothetical protein
MSFDQLTLNIEKFFSSKLKRIFPKAHLQLLQVETAKELEELFFDMVENLHVKALIECGANEASASIRVNRMGINALAIEANPDTFNSVTPPPSEQF